MIEHSVTSVLGTAHTLHCHKCTACCRWGAVILQSSDKTEDYETERTDGRIVLKRKPDSQVCWYLDDEKGCTIYDKRPAVCRAFDCRLYGLQKAGSKIVDRDREVILAGQARLESAVDELRRGL